MIKLSSTGQISSCESQNSSACKVHLKVVKLLFQLNIIFFCCKFKYPSLYNKIFSNKCIQNIKFYP